MAEVVRVCARHEVAPGTARRCEVAGRPVAVVRVDDDFFALGDTCSHEDYSLSEGEVWPDECEIECPKHGSAFDLRTGEPRTLPATTPVPVLAVRLRGDDVLVEVPADWAGGTARTPSGGHPAAAPSVGDPAATVSPGGAGAAAEAGGTGG